MAGDGAGCGGGKNFGKRHRFLQNIANHVDDLLLGAGVGDENPVGDNVGISGQLVFHILLQNRSKLAAILFADPHAAAGVVHLDGRQTQA